MVNKKQNIDIEENLVGVGKDLFNTLRDALVVLDPDLKVIYINYSFHKIFKSNFEDIINSSICSSARNIDDLEHNKINLHNLLKEILPQKKVIEDLEIRYPTSDKNDKILLINAAQVVNRTNGNRLILLSIEDITEKKRLLELTFRQNKLSAIGYLSAGIAHGLNSPLTGIQNILHIYFENEEKGTQKYKELKLMLQSCDFMSEIIKNLTYFSGKSNEKFKSLNIENVINQSLLFLSKLLMANNIVVVKNFSKKQVNVSGRTIDLQHVFLNLLINAKEAIIEKRIESTSYNKKGKIIITVSNNQNFANVMIQDNGIGITGEDLKKIFTPFFTTKNKIGGAGLGLAAAYGIIREHQGTIDVKSKKGISTKIIITLPLAK
jgi:two-component system, NtrC family, sensor kinase